VVAVLVLDEARYPGDAATLEGLREQLAAFKVPKALFAMAELPRNTMGKVQKNALRSHFEAIFGAEATP
jgi:malonyl-CoA/methylmalonyl-CoA synthetase